MEAAPEAKGRRGKRDEVTAAPEAKVEAKADGKKPAAKKGKADAKETKAEAKPAAKADGKKAAAAPVATGNSNEQIRLLVSLGKKNKVSPSDIRAILGAKLGADSARIGSIMLRDTNCIVKVPGDIAGKIISTVNGTKHAGAAIKVEVASN